MTYARSLLVIHNIAHQGRGPMAELSQMEIPASYREMFRLDDPIGGEHMNIMKAGIITAHRVVAVSHGYAVLFAVLCCVFAYINMSHVILLYSLVKHCAAAATGAYCDVQ